MKANAKRTVIQKFPLRLMPSVRRAAEEFSQKEGVSLNQFINVAVAEKLALLQHEQWLASRPKPTAARTAKALAVLDRRTGNAPEPGDELPEGYVSIKRSSEYKKALGTR
ncbi:MAG: toxin-antitoxin system HicB family antitoxin [Terracidiphilus sp.]